MKKFLLICLLCLSVMATTACQDDKAITFEKLPTAAQTFVKTYWSVADVSYVEKDVKWSSEYTVYMLNGDEIEFNNKGSWQSVDCSEGTTPREVPAGIVPDAVISKVEANYSGYIIVGIDSETNYYEVELWQSGSLSNNTIDLKISK